MTFTVRQAQIIGLFFETFLYGIHFIIFGVCLRCLLWDYNGLVLGQVKRGFLAMSVALFIISTLDIVLAVVNDYDGLMSPGSQDTLNTPVWLTISRVNLGIPIEMVLLLTRLKDGPCRNSKSHRGVYLGKYLFH